MVSETEQGGQLHTLGLLEQLCAESSQLWGNSSKVYFRMDKLLREPANPNLHDIPGNFPNRVSCGISTEVICAGSWRRLATSRSLTRRSRLRS